MQLTAVDLDPEMVCHTQTWAQEHRVTADVHVADYLDIEIDSGFDYAILNPPYVRQEWLDKKFYYQELFKERYGISVPGTSNLYVYFIVKVLMDLKPAGRFACIVYDSWQSTEFGRWLSNLMSSRCESIRVESVSGQPFRGRLIDATIIYGTKSSSHQVDNPPSFESEQAASRGPFFDVAGFSTVANLFRTRRGLRLKQASFFMGNEIDVQRFGATPLVKKIGRVKGFHVPEDHSESALFVPYGEHVSPDMMAELSRRLERAKQAPDRNISVLTWYRERPESWFMHREPPRDPIIFNYYIRNRPRHVFNPVRPYADNFYGLGPPDGVPVMAYVAVLNSTAVCVEILAHSRNQGSGLAKIQLFEYRRVAVPDLRMVSDDIRDAFQDLGRTLIAEPHHASQILGQLDSMVYKAFPDPRLDPQAVNDLYDNVKGGH